MSIRLAITNWASGREDAIFFWVMAGLIGFTVLVIVGLFVMIIAFATHPSAPSLFCPNGAEVRTSPDTVVVSKVPEDGTRFTCAGGVN